MTSGLGGHDIDGIGDTGDSVGESLADVGRDALCELLLREMPWYVSAAVRFQVAIADQLGMSVSDVHALGALLEFGPMGVRRLAELMGMTTGATTRLVDRLEGRGYVLREPDPDDRRRIVVRTVPDRVAEVAGFYEPMGERWRAQIDGYTDDQLRFLVRFLRHGRASAQAETAALRSVGRPHGTRSRG